MEEENIQVTSKDKSQEDTYTAKAKKIGEIYKTIYESVQDACRS